MANEDVLAFVAFKRQCGCAVGVAVVEDEHPERAAEFCVEQVKAGLRVETRTVGWARQNLNFCDHDPKQEELFEKEGMEVSML